VEVIWSLSDAGAFSSTLGFNVILEEMTGQVQRTDGDCVVTEDLKHDGGPTLTTTTYLSAGTLVAVFPKGEAASELQSSDDSYLTVPINGFGMSAGVTVDFSATGGIIPAFSGSLTAPTPVTFTNPLTEIDHTKDLVINWTGGASGGFVEVKIAETTPNYDVAVECAFDAAAGTGTVPAAAMTDLVPVSDSASPSSYVYYTSGVQQAVSPSPGGYPVTLKVQYLSSGILGVTIL
jgi:hypothetical protein